MQVAGETANERLKSLFNELDLEKQGVLTRQVRCVFAFLLKE